MDKNETFMGKWEKTRNGGRIRYIVLRGLLYYGLLFFLTWAFFVPFIDSNFTFNFVYRDTFMTKLIVFAIVYSLFGLIMGYVQWNYNEKKYNRNKC